jgi:hypothetical protein
MAESPSSIEHAPGDTVPISQQLAKLAKERPLRGESSEQRSVFKMACAESEAAIAENPKAAADQIEFIFANGIGTEAERFEAIQLLYHLGGIEGYQLRAIEVLGKAGQASDGALADTALQAIRGVSRRNAKRRT